MRLEDAGAQKEGFFQLAPEQCLCRPLRGFPIVDFLQGYIGVVRAPVGVSCYTFLNPVQGSWGGECEPDRDISMYVKYYKNGIDKMFGILYIKI